MEFLNIWSLLDQVIAVVVKGASKRSHFFVFFMPPHYIFLLRLLRKYMHIAHILLEKMKCRREARWKAFTFIALLLHGIPFS